MGKEEYKKRIKKLIKSEDFKKLEKYYNTDTIFDILGVTTDEKVHSNFLRWFFNTKGLNSIEGKSLKDLLKLLNSSKKEKSRIDRYNLSDIIENIEKGEYSISNINVTREKVTDDKTGFIDLYITFNISNIDNSFKKNITLMIENKIYSGINGEINVEQKAKKLMENDKIKKMVEEQIKTKDIRNEKNDKIKPKEYIIQILKHIESQTEISFEIDEEIKKNIKESNTSAKFKNQLDKYINYANEIEKENNNIAILVYLCPKNNIPYIFNEKKEGNNTEYNYDYILIIYEELLKQVLEPCFETCSKEKEKEYIGDYIKSINKTIIDKRLIITNEEDSILNSICKEYIKELEYMLNSILKLFDKDIISGDEKMEYALRTYSDYIEMLKPIFKYLSNYRNGQFKITNEIKEKFKSIDNIQRCNRIKEIKGEVYKGDKELLYITELNREIVKNLDKFTEKEKEKELIIYYTGRETPFALKDEEQFDKIPENKKNWYVKIKDCEYKYALVSFTSYEIEKFIEFLNENKFFKIERYK